jgi:hypothetical protein
MECKGKGQNEGKEIKRKHTKGNKGTKRKGENDKIKKGVRETKN